MGKRTHQNAITVYLWHAIASLTYHILRRQQLGFRQPTNTGVFRAGVRGAVLTNRQQILRVYRRRCVTVLLRQLLLLVIVLYLLHDLRGRTIIMWRSVNGRSSDTDRSGSAIGNGSSSSIQRVAS